MRILGIDHIGIASGDLGKHIEIFGDKLGLEIHDVEEKDPYGGLRAAFKVDESSSYRRRKSCGEIVLAKNFVAGNLRPVGKRRFIQAKIAVEIRHDEITALDHFTRRFGKARFVAVDQRQVLIGERTPGASGDLHEAEATADRVPGRNAHGVERGCAGL